MVRLSGGGQLTARQHLLSRDGRVLLVPFGPGLRVYSAATGELLHTLQGGHTDDITCLALHPLIGTQVYSGSRDGLLALWDFLPPAAGGGLVRTLPPVAGTPIEGLAVVAGGAPAAAPPAGGADEPAAAPAPLTAYVTVHWRGDEAGRFLAYDLRAGAPLPARQKLGAPHGVAAAAGGGLVATHDRHTVLCWAPAAAAGGGGAPPPLALAHTKPVTCVAVAPDGGRVAAGDATGRIVVWHDVQAFLGRPGGDSDGGGGAAEGAAAAAAAGAGPPAATVHWHAHAVGCLAFSSDGAFLLSGGAEAVLVVWEAATGRRAYLPRLGGALVGLATCAADPARVALRQDDNAFRVVSTAAMRVEASVRGLAPAPAPPRGRGAPPPSFLAASLAAPAALVPRRGLLAAAAAHGVLQFYDARRDAHADRLQLTPRALASPTDGAAAAAGGGEGKPPPGPAAAALAFSPDGEAMATVEARPAVGGAGVVHCLKFWDRNAGGAAGAAPPQYGAPYRLNTVADDPHRAAAAAAAAEAAGVTALAFHPSGSAAVTACGAGEFRLWARTRLPRAAAPRGGAHGPCDDPPSTWRCAAAGGYRGEPLGAAAFSPDGSLLAVAAGGGVTLWDAAGALALLAALPPPAELLLAGGGAPAPPVRRLAFVAGAPLLVAASDAGLAVYDLLARRAAWAAPAAVGALAADPSSPHWAAVVAADGGGAGAGGAAAVVAFRGADPAPAAAWRLRGPAAEAAPTQLMFAPPGTPLAAAGAPGRMSPLLVLSPGREYEVVGLGAGAVDERAAAGKAAAAAEGPGALEAMYGPLPPAAAAAGPAAPDGGALPEPERRRRLAALLDAPSHALPPLASLAPAFLELLVGGSLGSEE